MNCSIDRAVRPCRLLKGHEAFKVGFRHVPWELQLRYQMVLKLSDAVAVPFSHQLFPLSAS